MATFRIMLWGRGVRGTPPEVCVFVLVHEAEVGTVRPEDVLGECLQQESPRVLGSAAS